MSGRFKSNPFFLGMIKIIKDIKESVEAFPIIREGEGVTDHFTTFVHDEAVVFELRQVQTDEKGHNDTSYKHLYCMIDTDPFQSNYAFCDETSKVNLLINTRNKKDCGRSYPQTVSS